MPRVSALDRFYNKKVTRISGLPEIVVIRNGISSYFLAFQIALVVGLITLGVFYLINSK